VSEWQRRTTNSGLVQTVLWHISTHWQATPCAPLPAVQSDADFWIDDDGHRISVEAVTQPLFHKTREAAMMSAENKNGTGSISSAVEGTPEPLSSGRLFE
jgi:hypothetical protein